MGCGGNYLHTMHQLWGLGSAANSSAGFRANLRPPKGFSTVSALRMASPDTILLTVNYHAAIGGTPVPPLAYAPTQEQGSNHG